MIPAVFPLSLGRKVVIWFHLIINYLGLFTKVKIN